MKSITAVLVIAALAACVTQGAQAELPLDNQGAQAKLTLDNVAPADAVGVMSIRGFDAMIAKLSVAGLLRSEDREALNEYIRGGIGFKGADKGQASYDEIAEVWKALFKDQDPVDAMASIAAGLAVWIDSTDESTPVLTFATWVDLREDAAGLGQAWNATWESIRTQPHMKSEIKSQTVLGRSVDYFEYSNLVGSMASSSYFPFGIWMVQEKSHLLLSNTQSAMMRLLDALDGEELDDSLGDTEHWPAVKEMLDGPDSFLAAAFIHPTFEAVGLFDSMGMVPMIQGSFDAALGPIRAMAVSGGPGVGDALLSWSGAIWMPAGQGGMLRLLAHDTPREALPGWVGPDTSAVTRLNIDFKRIPDWIRAVIGSNPMLMGMGQMLDQSEVLMRSILDPLDRQMLQVQTVTRPLTSTSIASVMAVACTNPAALSDAIAATAPQADMEPRDFQGHQIWSTDLSNLGMPIPGIEGAMSVSVAGGHLLAGDESAVESVLRGLATRSSSPPAWLERVMAWLPDEPLSAWGAWDLAESMTAVAEIQRMQFQKWEDELKASDPELWEEIKLELVNEDQANQNDRSAALAKHLGPSAWWSSSADDGFRIRGVVMGVTPPAKSQ